MKTLDWIKANKLPTGGIAAWPGGPAYPEVTGYLIPTLYEWGERDLAAHCAEWLLCVQDPSGGFPGVDGSAILPAFDTAAALEGLTRAHKETGRDEFYQADQRARTFLAGHLLPDGFFRAWQGEGTRQYCVRINGLTHMDPLKFNIRWNDRTHFIAYALEGYLDLRYTQLVRAALEAIEFRPDGLAYLKDGEGDDVIATAQLAILKVKTGLDAGAQIEAVRRHVHANGGVPQSTTNPTEMSWGAKFYLDLERLLI